MGPLSSISSKPASLKSGAGSAAAAELACSESQTSEARIDEIPMHRIVFMLHSIGHSARLASASPETHSQIALPQLQQATVFGWTKTEARWDVQGSNPDRRHGEQSKPQAPGRSEVGP
jgi:hypothetical protein